MPLVIAVLAVGRYFGRSVISIGRNPEARGLLILTVSVIFLGASFYHSRFEPSIETWTDAIYFSVVTLTTVGYGDLGPTTPAAKWFTIVYIFVGLGIIAAFIGLIGDEVRLDSAERQQNIASRIRNGKQKPEA